MSFIYAERNNDHTLICSDTRITLDPLSRLRWGEQTYNAICAYGVIKSIIVCNECCISFAGNNIMLAHDLLEKITGVGEVSEEQLLEYALNIHVSAKPDDIEFIICTVDENRKTHIACIKNGEISIENQNAWIGSSKAFRKMQELRVQKTKKAKGIGLGTSGLFGRAMTECGDDTVGGFQIDTIYSPSENSFFYTEKLTMITGRDQLLQPGESIKFDGDAAEGAYTAYQHWSNEEVRIDLMQGDFSVLYTKKYRLEELDEQTKFFLLPIPYFYCSKRRAYFSR